MNSYSKVFNLGHRAVEDIFNNDVIIEEKIDGSQFSFGLSSQLEARSRNQIIDLDAPEDLFAPAIKTIKELDLHPGWKYRSETLKAPKHNTIAYNRVPKRNIIIFDIDTGDQKYLSYEDKVNEANRLGLEVVPLLYTKKPSMEEFEKLLQIESVLGGSRIEGVVIKNYSMFTGDGKTMMAKFVSEKFKEANNKNWEHNRYSGKTFLVRIVDELRTDARWNKSIQHLRENGELENSPRDIGKLIIELQKDLEEEYKEEILERFWKIYSKQIIRGITKGFPEYYKKLLAESQLGE